MLTKPTHGQVVIESSLFENLKFDLKTQYLTGRLHDDHLLRLSATVIPQLHARRRFVTASAEPLHSL